MYRPINLSIYHSINLAINQSILRSINVSLYQSINLSTYRSTYRPTYQIATKLSSDKPIFHSPKPSTRGKELFPEACAAFARQNATDRAI